MEGETEIGGLYRRSRERLTTLLGEAGADAWATPVPACPGWTVHDVVGHLVGVVEDALAGELTGIPGPEQTEAQVVRHRGDAPDALLARWGERAGAFEDIVGRLGVWPAAFDVGSHEQDVRGALGRPGARDDALVRRGARLLAAGVDAPATVAFDLGDETVHAGGASDGGDGGDTGEPGAPPDLTLRAPAFEVFRFRLGRRTAAQVAALDWSADPAPVLDALFVFGPAERPVVE